MFENKLIIVHDPYGFQLLVMGKRNHCILEQVLVEKSINAIRFLAIDVVVKEILREASTSQHRLEEQAVHMKNEFGKGK